MKPTFTKTILSLLFLLTLCLAFSSATADILGQPFPDFTATDTEGNIFTLSEALQTHDAAVINIWATWCPPCEQEFPDMNQVYAEYQDRVAFIALSGEPADTIQKIRDYRASHGIDFPMARDEGKALCEYIQISGFPTTVVVDRFGNAVFVRVGMFNTAGQLRRVLDNVLAAVDSAVLPEIPAIQLSNYPVAEARDIVVLNEGAQKGFFYISEDQPPLPFWVVDQDSASIRLDITSSDPIASMLFYLDSAARFTELPDLLDTDRNSFLYDLPMQPDTEYEMVYLIDATNPESLDYVEQMIIWGESNIETILDYFRSEGLEVTWEWAE